MTNPRGPPTACPECGGDVEQSDDGPVCVDCGSLILSLNTRGRGDTDGGD